MDDEGAEDRLVALARDVLLAGVGRPLPQWVAHETLGVRVCDRCGFGLIPRYGVKWCEECRIVVRRAQVRAAVARLRDRRAIGAEDGAADANGDANAPAGRPRRADQRSPRRGP